MRKLVILAAAALPLLSGGCIAKTLVDVVTLPVKAGAQAADWATTSQDESDRNYGRKMRKKEAQEGREQRARDKECRKHPEKCSPDEVNRAHGRDGFRADPGANRY